MCIVCACTSFSYPSFTSLFSTVYMYMDLCSLSLYKCQKILIRTLCSVYTLSIIDVHVLVLHCAACMYMYVCNRIGVFAL